MYERDINAKQLKNVLFQKWYTFKMNIDKFHIGEILCAITVHTVYVKTKHGMSLREKNKKVKAKQIRLTVI